MHDNVGRDITVRSDMDLVKDPIPKPRQAFNKYVLYSRALCRKVVKNISSEQHRHIRISCMTILRFITHTRTAGDRLSFQSSELGHPNPSPARECCSPPPLGPVGTQCIP
jgi:hypothetical protein